MDGSMSSSSGTEDEWVGRRGYERRRKGEEGVRLSMMEEAILRNRRRFSLFNPFQTGPASQPDHLVSRKSLPAGGGTRRRSEGSTTGRRKTADPARLRPTARQPRHPHAQAPHAPLHPSPAASLQLTGLPQTERRRRSQPTSGRESDAGCDQHTDDRRAADGSKANRRLSKLQEAITTMSLTNSNFSPHNPFQQPSSPRPSAIPSHSLAAGISSLGPRKTLDPNTATRATPASPANWSRHSTVNLSEAPGSPHTVGGKSRATSCLKPSPSFQQHQRKKTPPCAIPGPSIFPAVERLGSGTGTAGWTSVWETDDHHPNPLLRTPSPPTPRKIPWTYYPPLPAPGFSPNLLALHHLHHDPNPPSSPMLPSP